MPRTFLSDSHNFVANGIKHDHIPETKASSLAKVTKEGPAADLAPIAEVDAGVSAVEFHSFQRNDADRVLILPALLLSIQADWLEKERRR